MGRAQVIFIKEAVMLDNNKSSQNNSGIKFFFKLLLQWAPLLAAVAAILGLIFSNYEMQQSMELERKIKAMEFYVNYFNIEKKNFQFSDTTFTFNEKNWKGKYAEYAVLTLVYAEILFVLQGKVAEWNATLEHDMLRPHLYFYKSVGRPDTTYNKDFRLFCNNLIKKYCRNEL